MAASQPPALRLLEPGALFEGALFRNLLRTREVELDPGMRLGVFKLVREIGRGGMGVVWLAERDDGEYRQQVAIKCIVDQRSEQGAELFRRERQILSELRHPNIARLLDGGRRDDGLLWFAMELIEGVAIDQHARDGALTLEARLQLFADAIDAVSVAHARLVIHRDLKPGNVLVDADGRAKLLDFGIAALAGDADAARAYSPGWASPEQRAGDTVTAASDQFQLGALLETVLRNPQHPADPGTGVGLLDPARWIAMPRHRQRELQAVLARACANAPEARYRSVAELGHELERMVENRPVLALARRNAYPLACAVRRRPVAIAASSLTALLIAIIVVVFTGRLARERDVSRAEAARAEVQAQLARTEAATSQAINRFLNEDLLTAADPYGENLKDVPIGEVIERALPRVAARLGTQPAVAGEVYRTLGSMLLNLGRYEPARVALDRSVLALSLAHGAFSSDTIEARTSRAEVEGFAGRFGEQEKLLGALRTDLLALGERDARRIRVDRLYAWAQFVLGRTASAEQTYRDVLRRSEHNPAISDLDRATALGGHSLALWRLGRSGEALEEARKGHAIRLRELGPDHPDTLQSLLHIASALNGLERMDEAIAAYRELHKKAVARFGAGHAETQVLAHELGVVLIRANRAEEAIPYLEQTVAAKSAQLGSRSGSTVNSINWLGLAFLRAERFNDAARLLEGVQDFVGASESDRRTAIALDRNIGELRLAQGRASDALASCSKGLVGSRDLVEANHPLRLGIEACRGIALVESGHDREGRAVLERVAEPLRASGTQALGWSQRVQQQLGTLSVPTRD